MFFNYEVVCVYLCDQQCIKILLAILLILFDLDLFGKVRMLITFIMDCGQVWVKCGCTFRVGTLFAAGLLFQFLFSCSMSPDLYNNNGQLLQSV